MRLCEGGRTSSDCSKKNFVERPPNALSLRVCLFFLFTRHGTELWRALALIQKCTTVGAGLECTNTGTPKKNFFSMERISHVFAVKP